MTRSAALYRDGGTAAAPAGSVDATVPTPGLYRMRLVRDGHPVAIKIIYGPPQDPDTGELLDRSYRHQVFVNNVYEDDLTRYWPVCAQHPIDEAEHDHLVALHKWGKENCPDGPQAKPYRPVDLLLAPVPF